MFRASLRSVSDPLRDHVCFSCLARSFGGRRAQTRSFYSTPLRRTELGHGGDDGASIPSQDNVADSLTKIPLSEGNKSRPPTGPPHDSKLTHRPDSDLTKTDRKKKPSKAKKKEEKKAARKARKKNEKEKEKGIAPGKLDARTGDDTGKDGSEKKELNSELEPLQSITKKLQRKPPKDFPQPPGFIMNSVQSRERGKLDSQGSTITPLDIERPPVPQLSFGLQRVLFNPGVYHLRDPRSRVFNFDPYLGSIMPVTEFDFAALKEYITSSKDDILQNIATKEQKKYIGSSSSMTSVLSHFHYLLSAWRPIDTRTLSQGFTDKLRTFTRLLRAPAAMFLRYKDGVYAIDADKEFDSANILMNLGKSMEKLLTLPKEDFERYRRSSENKITIEEEHATPEAYHYSTFGDFIMRSQLDAYDPRLPGTGMFDLKTRAVVSVRMDARNFENGLGYQIKSQYGLYESYEREFFDMIRAAFLKYSLQVRVGRMDGIFVAFHNIERIFGFQYISLPEMDQTLHGQADTSLGDAEFRLSLTLWNNVLNKATAKFPQKSLRFHFETRDAKTPFMYIFAEPVTEDEIHAIQTKNKAAIDAYQQRVLNLAPHEINDTPSSYPSSPTTAGSIQDSLTDQANEASESTDAEEASVESSDAAPDGREVLAMTLIVKNFVNGKHVERPEGLTAMDKWTVEYELSELNGPQSQALYTACQKRREKELSVRGEDDTDIAANVYIRKLRQLSEQGRKYRKEQEKLDQEHGVVVLDDVKV